MARAIQIHQALLQRPSALREAERHRGLRRDPADRHARDRPRLPRILVAEAGLRQAHEVVRRLKEEAQTAYVDDRGTVFNQDVLGAIELGYMLDCAEATIVSAIDRKESRGAQFRLDYPERKDDEWLKHINVTRGPDGEPQISYSPVTITRWQPEVRKY